MIPILLMKAAVKYILVVAALAFAATAAAQQQRPSDDEINLRIQLIEAQRNAAQSQIVAVTASAETQIKALMVKVEKLEKDVAACAPKKEPEKK